MRPLTDDETRIFQRKLEKYIGKNIERLIDRPDGEYCFRLHRERIYYVSQNIMKWATNICRENLISLGVCFGKFTKTKQFFLHVTALEYLAPYAKYKIWLKPSAEQSFLYGNNVIKSGVGRITEGTEANEGVVLLSMSDLPLGFGVSARTTAACRSAGPLDIIAFHQADVGEYIRREEALI